MNDPVDAQRILQLVFMVHREAGPVLCSQRYRVCLMFTEIEGVCYIQRDAGCI